MDEALWRYRDAPAFKSYSPDVRERACLVQTPVKVTLSLFFSENSAKIPAQIMTLIQKESQYLSK